jgi:C1A family cysteine protease
MSTAQERFYDNRGNLGWRIDLEDFGFLARGTADDSGLPPWNAAEIPDSMNVQDWLQIEDQGQQGSCQGHARTTAAEIAIYRATRQKVQLNRQFAYITSQIVDGIRGDQGSTITGGARASMKYGEALESLWPYSGRYDTRIPQACYDDGQGRKLRSYKQLRTYDDVMRWLVHGVGGIVIGIRWNPTCEPDSYGRIMSYNPRSGGGHALAFCDWSKKHSKNEPFIVKANSWGRKWGDDGFAYVSPGVVQAFCETQTVVGYSDMEGDAIKPRSFDWINERVL